MGIEFIFRAISVALGGGIIIVVAYYLIRGDIMTYLKTIKAAVPEQNDKNALLPLRLQAHERMIIFIDRINPSNLLIRLHQQGIGADALQMLIISEIRTEYQHNIAQQLYIGPVTWNVIRKLKDDTIAMVNNAVKNLPEEQTTGVDLSKKILNHMSAIEENPYELTMELVKKDIQKLF